MFQALRDIAKKITQLEPNRMVFEIISKDKDLQNEILDLNREKQLFEKGINSEGVRLDSIYGGYAYYTIQYKQVKGQPTDRITLKDTGEFYRSFRVRASLDYFEIDANAVKGPSDNLFDDWGEDILGLTDESKTILTGYLIPIMRDKLIKQL